MTNKNKQTKTQSSKNSFIKTSQQKGYGDQVLSTLKRPGAAHKEPAQRLVGQPLLLSTQQSKELAVPVLTRNEQECLTDTLK